MVYPSSKVRKQVRDSSNIDEYWHFIVLNLLSLIHRDITWHSRHEMSTTMSVWDEFYNAVRWRKPFHFYARFTLNLKLWNLLTFPGEFISVVKILTTSVCSWAPFHIIRSGWSRCGGKWGSSAFCRAWKEICMMFWRIIPLRWKEVINLQITRRYEYQNNY